MAAINLPPLPEDPPRVAVTRALYRHLDVVRTDLPTAQLTAFIDDLASLLQDNRQTGFDLAAAREERDMYQDERDALRAQLEGTHAVASMPAAGVRILTAPLDGRLVIPMSTPLGTAG